MIRLADPQAEAPETSFEVQQSTIQALEEEYKKDLAPHVPHAGKGMAPTEYFKWAEELKQLRPALQNLEHWDQIESQMIAPHANQVFQVLSRHFSNDKEKQAEWEHWRDRYVPEFLSLLKVLRMEAAEKSAKQIHAIREKIDPLLPESKREEPFSRKALWVLTSTPGVTSVLNGIRKPAYVNDSLTILQWESLPASKSMFEAVGRCE